MPNVDKNGEIWPDSDSDLNLNTSANLPECPITEGLDVNSLSPATTAALTHGFQTDIPNEDQGPRGEATDANESPEATEADPRKYPGPDGFIRPESFRKESTFFPD